jgi:hypothetical protein
MQRHRLLTVLMILMVLMSPMFLMCPKRGVLQVRLIEEAGAQHRKDVRDAKRSAAGRERTAAAGGDAARIAAALAADRAERAAAAPVRPV